MKSMKSISTNALAAHGVTESSEMSKSIIGNLRTRKLWIFRQTYMKRIASPFHSLPRHALPPTHFRQGGCFRDNPLAWCQKLGKAIPVWSWSYWLTAQSQCHTALPRVCYTMSDADDTDFYFSLSLFIDALSLPAYPGRGFVSRRQHVGRIPPTHTHTTCILSSSQSRRLHLVPKEEI